MATRDQLYAKFGITAEAAQLFETELGTLLLCARGLESGWHVIPDGESARDVLREVDRSTLGGLLSKLKRYVDFDENLSARFASALAARNRLNHGFYERHNFSIQTDEGRDEMLADLETLHGELFTAWQLAGAMTSMVSNIIVRERERGGPPT
ncbi:hypothetical protein [Reyranella sp.]|uniref:hypothetical protein n=1 Tax=Reyranella sp. TaxID=1929291 RepID=UPI003BA9B47E